MKKYLECVGVVALLTYAFMFFVFAGVNFVTWSFLPIPWEVVLGFLRFGLMFSVVIGFFVFLEIQK